MLVKVAPRRVGDPGRIATVALRAGPVILKRPRHGSAKTDPETVSMTLARDPSSGEPGAAALAPVDQSRGWRCRCGARHRAAISPALAHRYRPGMATLKNQAVVGVDL